MIRRGMKKKAFCNKKQGAPCPKCGAVGNESCKNMSNHTALKNNHKERV